MNFEGYVATRSQTLLRFAYLLTGDFASAEDVVQSALLDAFRHWSRISRTDHPDAYVRRVVLNTYLAGRRRRRSTEIPTEVPSSLIPDQMAPPSRADPEASAVAVDAFRHVVGSLPDRARAIIVLRYYLDLPDGEIAKLLGITESTVRSTASRAIDSLRATLATQTDE